MMKFKKRRDARSLSIRKQTAMILMLSKQLAEYGETDWELDEGDDASWIRRIIQKSIENEGLDPATEFRIVMSNDGRYVRLRTEQGEKDNLGEPISERLKR
jgi:hypothetical protein